MSTLQPAELESICRGGAQCGCSDPPCIDPVFGPTKSDYYWSATTLAHNPYYAFYMDFGGDGKDYYPKTDPRNYVRAVRSGW